MRRLTFLAAAVLVASLPISTAEAEPFAGDIDRAALATRVIGADGREWLVQIQVEELVPLAGAPTTTAWVAIDVCEQGGCEGTAFALSLDPEEFTLADDMAEAELTTEVAGRPLHLVWRCGESCAAISGGVTIAVGGSISNSSVRDMSFDGELFGIGCSGQGAAERETRVDPAGASSPPVPRAPKTLPKGFLDGRGKPRCTGLPSKG